MNLDKLIEKYDNYILSSQENPIEFILNEDNAELNENLISDLLEVEYLIEDDLDKSLYASMFCFALSSKLHLYKAREGLFKNGVNYATTLDEPYRRYQKIYKDEILETCKKMLTLVDDIAEDDNGTKNSLVAAIYVELSGCCLCNGIEKNFLNIH